MKILLLNQCFYPDVAATAQYTSELARALASRGNQVTVIASGRGYDDPSLRFPPQEVWEGVSIFRVPCLPTGKGSKVKRALNIGSFFLTCFWRLLLLGRFDTVLALTSPPLISAMAALFVKLKGGRFIYWIMDLNPDEAIAAGWLRADSQTARVLESALMFSANTASSVIVLDRFMRDRMAAKGLPPRKMSTLPPWSHDNEVRFNPRGRDAFRAAHGLTGKFVVMYSGNHSPCHPLDTILQAAGQLVGRTDIVFCFVGGGSELKKVHAFMADRKPGNVLCLPYQPLRELSASLSSADLHLVVLGEPLAGLVHPCKIYNVMAIGIPVLYIGPAASHIGDIAAAHPDLPISMLEHGDVTGVVDRILAGAASALPHERMRAAAKEFSVDCLLPRYTALIENA
ncbi:MAG TPA: glycosyltransferase family 4 protein [Bryobacteraceae bacterium]|jgi:glycosyltransferase involved in cell wall biosynthesis|nr:glycosyltransferase family 4 protein [Bryobacteraceae bacterium]